MKTPSVVIVLCCWLFVNLTVSEPPPYRRKASFNKITTTIAPITQTNDLEEDPMDTASSNNQFNRLRHDEYDMYAYNNNRPGGGPNYYGPQGPSSSFGLDKISRMGSELIERFASSFDSASLKSAMSYYSSESGGGGEGGCCKFEFNSVVPAGVLILISYFFLLSLTTTAGRRRRRRDVLDEDDEIYKKHLLQSLQEESRSQNFVFNTLFYISHH